MENETGGYVAQIEDMHSEVQLKMLFGRAERRSNNIKIKERE
jgi:hypothetical protein